MAVSPSPTTKNKKRLPRFQRSDSAPPMRLTARDREILRAVFEYKALTREQIQRLIFPTTRQGAVIRRLRLLYHHGYLARIPIPTPGHTLAYTPVYRLAAGGAAIVAFEQHITTDDLIYWGKADDREKRTTTDIKPIFVSHMLSINDVRIAVHLAAQKNGWVIERWLDENYFKVKAHKDFVEVETDRGKRKLPVLPDAYFTIAHQRRSHFLVEADRATESDTSDWRLRVLTYLVYMKGAPSLYEKRFKTKSLRILTITTSLARVKNIKRVTEAEHGEGRFWFTTFELATPERILTAPIWYRAGEDAPLSLIDLQSKD